MKDPLLSLFIVLTFVFLGCSKSELMPKDENSEKDEIDNIFSGTTWLRNDVVGEIFWGGKNQFRLFFKNKNDFED